MPALGELLLHRGVGEPFAVEHAGIALLRDIAAPGEEIARRVAGVGFDLLRAARLLETNAEMVKETNELLRVERVRGDANSELRKTLEDGIVGLENEIAALKTQLSESQARLNAQNLEAEARQSELLRRAEEAEEKLALVQQELATRASDDTHILVPVTTLCLAKAQFESLASGFAKVGNIVSQTMCEASASSLERAIMDILWDSTESLTVRQVGLRLTNRDLAHTTVMTVLDRLAKKGFAHRQRDGRAWLYRRQQTGKPTSRS